MKSHEEIKKGLECALCDEPADLCGEDCPCWSAYSPAEMRQDEHVSDALAYILQLEAQVPRWISVEEKLPEERAVVLVVREENLYGREVTIGWTRCGKWELPIGAKITHWMPLPEPPEVNEK